MYALLRIRSYREVQLLCIVTCEVFLPYQSTYSNPSFCALYQTGALLFDAGKTELLAQLLYAVGVSFLRTVYFKLRIENRELCLVNIKN